MTRIALHSIAWLAVAVTIAPLPAQTPARSAVVAIKAGHLIDGRGGPPVTNVVIVIEDDRIVAVGPGVPIPAPGSSISPAQPSCRA